MQVTILGTSAARPYVDRPPSSVYISHDGSNLLIDCGEGIQVELDRNGCSSAKLDAIAITHMHGDHVFGLPGLLTSMALNGRNKKLLLIGPKELEEFITSVLAFAGAHLTYVIQYMSAASSHPPNGPIPLRKLMVQPVPLRHRIECSGYLVSTAPLGKRIRGEAIKHHAIPYEFIPQLRQGQDFITASGERIPNGDLTLPAPAIKQVAYLTDTAPLGDYNHFPRDIDLVIHDATFADEEEKLANKTGHSTGRQAAKFARSIDAKLLVLTHYSNRYKDPERLCEQAKELFGNTQLASPGNSYQL